MKTQNEKIQKYISEALAAARRDRVPKEAQGIYCAVFLARKLVSIEHAPPRFSQLEREVLAEWAAENMDYVRDIFNDLDAPKICALIKSGEFEFGDYILQKIAGAKLYDEQWQDIEPDTTAENDLRERTRDYKLEELGVW